MSHARVMLLRQSVQVAAAAHCVPRGIANQIKPRVCKGGVDWRVSSSERIGFVLDTLK